MQFGGWRLSASLLGAAALAGAAPGEPEPPRAIAAEPPGGAQIAATAETVSVGVAETPDFTRLSFRFSAPATLTPLQSGDRLQLRFSRSGELDLAPVAIDPPRFVRAARVTSAAGQRLAVTLDLEPGARQRHFVEGAQVVVDLLPPQAERPSPPPAPAAAQGATPADPSPPGGVARLQLVETPSATTLSLRWAGPARAAAFRRGEALWLVFDSQARISVEGVPRVGRRHQDLRPVRGEGFTALRVAASPAVQLSARADGPVWTFTLADAAAPAGPESRVEPAREQVAAGVRLAAPFGRAGVVRTIEDPVVGDRFAVGLIPGPTLGVAARRANLEAALLPTVHGAAADIRADGAQATFADGTFAVSRGQGLIAAGALSRGGGDVVLGEGLVPRAGYDMLDIAGLQEAGATPRDVLDALQRRAAAEGTEEGAETAARIALARFLLANELGAEALGALRLAAVNQPQLQVDPEYRLMRASASLMMGRVADAQKDLSASGLAEDPTAALWRSYAAAASESWTETRRQLDAGRAALAAQSPGWRARFLLAGAEAALALRDLPAAEGDVAAALSAADAPSLRAQAQVLAARIMAAKGDANRALRMFDELSRSRDEASSVRASLEAVRLRRAMGQLTPEQAAEQLDALRFRWRGDAIELEIVQSLAAAYADLGRWRDGLTLMRQAAMRFGEAPAARRLRLEMAQMFERLYLDGGADALDPIQALGLFYDFKDLTPYGPDGDRMVRLLAGRLAAMDLMEQAAALLQHQVSERLEGIGQAQIAADLAALYLADNRPEQAIAALQSTRQPRLPADLVAERRILEATALLRLGRYDHAEELVEKDRSAEAQRVRAESAWRQKRWPEAAAALQALFAMRRPPDAPLTPEDRDVVLRLAVAQALAGDRAGLAETRRRRLAQMAGTAEEEAFEVITDAPDPAEADIAAAVRRLARTDLLDRFMTRLRERAAPAAPEAAAAPGQTSQAPPAPSPQT